MNQLMQESNNNMDSMLEMQPFRGESFIDQTLEMDVK
jgi:hypothetical protein